MMVSIGCNPETKIRYYICGSNMKASELVYIDDNTAYRCTYESMDVHGMVAYIDGIIDYVVGDIVPVIFLEVKEGKIIQKTCPRCNGRGYVEYEI